MKTITLNSGKIVTFDDSFNPGDLITAYRNGYHEFIRYEDRTTTYSPLVYYKPNYQANGKPVTSKQEFCCDASFCKQAKDSMTDEIKKKKAEIKALQAIQATL